MSGTIAIPTLYQSEEWIKRDGTRLRVADMNRDHILNILAFLERKVDDLALADTFYWARMSLPSEDTMAWVSITSEIDRQAELKNKSVLTWLGELPLVRAFQARLAEDVVNEIAEFLGGAS